MEQVSGRRSRRAEILEVSLQLFLRRGYNGTPTREIAEEIGTSKANVYHHFHAKDDILRAMFRPLFEQMEEFLAAHGPPTGSKGDRRVLEEYFDLILAHRGLVALLGTDNSVLGRPNIGEKVEGLNRRLQVLVLGNEAGLEDRVWVRCAITCLRAAAVNFPEEDPQVIRRVGLTAATAALNN